MLVLVAVYVSLILCILISRIIAYIIWKNLKK